MSLSLQVCGCDWTGRGLRTACIDWESGGDNWTSSWSTTGPTHHQEGQVKQHNNTQHFTKYNTETEKVYQYSSITNCDLPLIMPLPSADVLKWGIRNVISILTSVWFCTLSWQTHTINLRSRPRPPSSTLPSHGTGSRTSFSRRWSTWRDRTSNISRCVCVCVGLFNQIWTRFWVKCHW